MFTDGCCFVFLKHSSFMKYDTEDKTQLFFAWKIFLDCQLASETLGVVSNLFGTLKKVHIYQKKWFLEAVGQFRKTILIFLPWFWTEKILKLKRVSVTQPI